MFESLPRPAADYGVILADPPWKTKAFSEKGQGRAPERHYQTMTLEDICSMPVRDLGGKDCHLFLWTTAPHLEQSFEVLRAWGFRYSSTAFIWIKLRKNAASALMMTDSDFSIGLGKTTRKNAEICLLGRRGRPKRCASDIAEVIFAARREHSRKPDQSYERIIRYSGDVPRVELFSRETRPGFDPWGNEIGKFK